MSLLLAALLYNLGVTAIFQDEAPYMKEWIDHHRSVGADHFWLYNNNSSDNYLEVLKPYIEEGVVELIEWPSIKEELDWDHHCFDVQPAAYSDALVRARTTAKWLAIIDLDEFIIPVADKSIPKLLADRFPIKSRIGGVCINWLCYGTSHVYKAPDGKMLDHLTWRGRKNHPENLHFKSIVRPNRVINCTNPHLCNYIPGFFHVTTAYEPCAGKTNTVRLDVLRINHYWTRDEWFLTQVKIPRYLQWGHTVEMILDRADRLNQIYDPIAKSPK
jgi:hypothetical protein